MKLVNLTPHAITVVQNGKTLEIPPSDRVARVDVRQTVVGHVNGIPIVKSEFGEIAGLPEPQQGVVYICSTMVAQAAAKKMRIDVLAPDTGPTAIRDESGRIVAVRRFQIF
ncbi:MAG: hypothetical protein ACXQS1_05835 [Methermicoccaceae archaeon]